MSLQDIVSPKLFEQLERTGISTAKQILVMSLEDMVKLTGLNESDVSLVKSKTARYACPAISTCFDLRNSYKENRIKTGIHSIDNMLARGFRCGTITEIYGESGTGKTQIGIQTAIHNWERGCVYICTEDMFPTRRFNQMKENIKGFLPENDYGKHIFVEHITEADDLLSCIRVRIPWLLKSHNLSAIIVDSVAAPFRTESTDYIQRAEDLREFAVTVIKIAQEFDLAVLCINQVTSSFLDTDMVLPSLGLAWSNMVSTRLWLKKSQDTCKSIEDSGCESLVRQLMVVFAPDLNPTTTEFCITSKGLEEINDYTM